MGFSLFVSYISLESLIRLGSSLGFLELSFHILDELSKLPILFIAFLKGSRQLRVLLLHLTDNCIALLELLLDNLEFLRVSKRVLGPDYFLELVSESGTLFHVQLDFNFDFLLACAPYVPLQRLSLVSSAAIFSLQVLDFAFQINDKVCVGFETTSHAVTSEFGRLIRQPKVGLLLDHQVIDDFIFPL